MKLAVFGLTVTSSWGNGHATTYRSLFKALKRRGHTIHFVEKDVEWYRSNRDLPEPEFCTVTLYEDWGAEAQALLRSVRDCDAIIVGSYFPDAIEATRMLLESARAPVLFYDIDTPITLHALRTEGRTGYLTSEAIPGYAAYLSFTGGPALRELESRFGAQRAIAFYCSVDSDLYKPTPIEEQFRCDLSYLGTYARDRQGKLEDLLCRTANALGERRFLVAGPQYPAEIAWPGNLKRIIHVPPREHPAFYSSSRYTLNLTRDDMVEAGYSPSVRLFEASACGAAILSDRWAGLEEFLSPGKEILLPSSSAEVQDILLHWSDRERIRMGQMARERILAAHTSEHRAAQFEEIVAECSSRSTALKSSAKD